jgi:hypothetical protein
MRSVRKRSSRSRVLVFGAGVTSPPNCWYLSQETFEPSGGPTEGSLVSVRAEMS